LRRLSRDALIDGIPYRQYWGEVLASGGEPQERMGPKMGQKMGPRYRILLPEDEAEVERLYQRLKSVGNLDQKNSTDEK
jgi:hemerythrin superfamily protein